MTKPINKDAIRTIGRRKRASARVIMTPGKGVVTINGRELSKFFGSELLIEKVLSPFKLMGKEGIFDVSVKVEGGGITGQAEAIRHGISRALLKWNEDFRKTLRTAGFLTRDPREKERKKFGLKRARRAPQWSKR